MIGSEIGGCKIIEVIGEGGFGTVYKAVQTELDRTVAVKLLQPDASVKGKAKWFAEEARLIGKLEHPNVVRTHYYGYESGMHYVVMEYLEGRTLDKEISEGRRMQVDEAVSIARQIATGLEYAHRAGVIHSDLNPRNIMLTQDGRVVIGDFIGGRSEDSGGRTVIGVPEYISPEQARGLSATFKSDIYSLGVILYEMLTGRPPFSEAAASDTLFRQISSDPEPPDKLNSAVPLSLSKLVMKMLAKNPDMRPDNCGAVISGLDAARAEMSANGVSGEVNERKPVSIMLLVALVAVLSALGGVGWLVQRSIAQEREFEALASASPAVQATVVLKQSVAARYNEEMQRGQNFLSQQRYRQAATSFHRACKLRPDKVEPHLYLAAIFIRRNEYRMANTELETVLKIDPNNKDAKASLSYVRSKLPKE